MCLLGRNRAEKIISKRRYILYIRVVSKWAQLQQKGKNIERYSAFQKTECTVLETVDAI